MSLFCTSVATYIPCYHIVSTFASNLLSSLICWNVTLEHIIKVKIAFFSPLRRQSSTHTSEFSVPARLHRWKLRTGKRLINQQFELRTRNSIRAISRRYCTRKTPLMDVAQKSCSTFLLNNWSSSCSLRAEWVDGRVSATWNCRSKWFYDVGWIFIKATPKTSHSCTMFVSPHISIYFDDSRRFKLNR